MTRWLPFSQATKPRYRGGRYSFPWITPLYHLYFIMLNVKQGGIKYHFLSLLYDSKLGLNHSLQAHWLVGWKYYNYYYYYCAFTSESSFRFVNLFVWVYDTSTVVGYLKPNPFLYKQTVLFQTIQFTISTQFNCKIYLFQAIQFSQTILLSIRVLFVYTLLNVKTVLFQTIQFSVSRVSISKSVRSLVLFEP